MLRQPAGGDFTYRWKTRHKCPFLGLEDADMLHWQAFPVDAEMLRWLAFSDLRRRKQWIFLRKNRFVGLGVAQMFHWLAFSDLMRRKHTFFH